MLQAAKKGNYAVGQYNINSLQWAQAILQAAEEEKAPVIAAVSDRLVDYLGGFKTIVGMTELNPASIAFLHLSTLIP